MEFILGYPHGASDHLYSRLVAIPCTELQLRCPNKPKYRLGHLLQRKAREGVKIHIILHVTSIDLLLARKFRTELPLQIASENYQAHPMPHVTTPKHHGSTFIFTLPNWYILLGTTIVLPITSTLRDSIRRGSNIIKREVVTTEEGRETCYTNDESDGTLSGGSHPLDKDTVTRSRKLVNGMASWTRLPVGIAFNNDHCTTCGLQSPNPDSDLMSCRLHQIDHHQEGCALVRDKIKEFMPVTFHYLIRGASGDVIAPDGMIE
ncbi:hypothetical protein F4604DRAFT_1677388 [Suillus subluteus]|nr:hypothetical protein F4604DRAFT_1677388 [Suillus subluteus]